MIDEMIRRRGLDAPPAEPDDADTPVDLDPPLTLDLRAHEVSSVVWCTGFTGDFSWLDPRLVGGDGLPRREGAAAVARRMSQRSPMYQMPGAQASCTASPRMPRSSPRRSGVHRPMGISSQGLRSRSSSPSLMGPVPQIAPRAAGAQPLGERRYLLDRAPEVAHDVTPELGARAASRLATAITSPRSDSALPRARAG
jgi:hypothetical protein